MQNLKVDSKGHDTGIYLQELQFGEELKKWQKHFHQMTGIFAYLVDGRGEPLTDMTGKTEEINKIHRAITKEQVQNLVARVTENALEDQAIEYTDTPNLRLAAISIKKGGKLMATWVMCAIISDADCTDYTNPPLEGFEKMLTEAEFSRAIDVMREISQVLLEYQYLATNAQAENRRSQFSQREMEEVLHKTEAMTEIVQLLDNDDSIEVIIQKLLETAGRYLNISVAALFSVHHNNELMDVIGEWRKEGMVPLFDQNANQKSIPFLFTDKPIVISADTMIGSAEREEIGQLGIKALTVLPVFSTETNRMYALFGDAYGERSWQTQDIKFVSDAVKILHSILTRRIQKNSLASSYASLETILDNVGSAIYVKDEQTGKMLFANRNMRNIFRPELENGTLHEFISKERISENGNSEIYHESSGRWYDLYITGIKWVDGRPVYLYALYDITEKKLYQRKIEQQAYSDFLTGLYNRMCCERDLAKYIDEASKAHAEGALLYLDLDDFKHINDGLGHQYGDVLLKAIAHGLQRIEGIEDTCYRMGGDEFVIIVPVESFPMLDDILRAIGEIFEKPWFLKDADYYCTMSMGLACFPSDGNSVHDLIKKADIAMYEAKRSGKNRYARYAAGTDFKSGKRLDMEKNMRDATVSGYREFEIYYQPIIDLKKSGTPCTGAEALIRWNSEEMGFIPPSEFIPLAEYLGLINPIGNYVLMEACKRCRHWNDNGYPEYKINVNLSVVQLLQPDIVQIVEKALKETGINPHNLTLEVTESLAINDMERMKDILENIKKLGVRIALDDFGTGYSSLNHIREIPFDVIKVDQTFIKDLETDAYSRSFIKMVVQLAEAIDVNICIEGVETKEQYRILSDMNVGLIQGYYFDRPIPGPEFERKYTPNLEMVLKVAER